MMNLKRGRELCAEKSIPSKALEEIMGKEKTLYLHDMSYMAVAAHLRTCDVAMVPMGSLERHGAHLPLGCDALTTWEVVIRASQKASVIYTPIIPYGYSPHHMHEPGRGTGTITLSGETYRRVVYDIGKSLLYHGFNKIVFVTHHGSNSKVVDEVLRRIRYESGAFTCWYKTPTEREYNALQGIIEGPPEETPGWHSGEIETSTCLAYDESLVDMSVAVQDRTHAPQWMGPTFSKKDGSGMVEFMETEQAWVPMEHHEYSTTSTIGNPFRGTKEKGLKYFERSAEHLAAFLEEVKKFPVQATNREFNNRA
jgi:creatinine amidohydrolase